MLTFPYSILKARSFQLDIVGSVITGGMTNNGQQQRVNAAGGGLWALRLEFPTLRTRDQLRSWRVIQYGSQGGVVPVNVAICDLRQAPVPSDWSGSGDGVPHSDDSPFSDGSLYASAIIVANLAANSLVRATTIQVEFEADGVPLGGEFFSMTYGAGKHELHVVVGVELVTGTTYELTVEPPMRAAHTAGETVVFDHPVCTYVLAQADAMSMATEMGRRGTGSAQFIEYLG